MTADEMAEQVKANLRLEDGSRDQTISDIILAVCDYCNLLLDGIPEMLEPFVRKKVKGIMDYEAEKGSGYQPEISSIKEGDGTITWSQTEGNTRASIFGLSDSDKSVLKRYRRLRGYV